MNGVSSHFLGAPFGGYKQSGLGREECLEERFLDSQLKNVNVNIAADCAMRTAHEPARGREFAIITLTVGADHLISESHLTE